jgi:hypothetical protein
MKRVGHLLERIAEPENLRLAFWKAARGKRAKVEVRQFQAGLADELRRMRDGLLAGDYPIGCFHRFIVHDPKERVIHAAAFPERVLHHAIMNVCEPVFERAAIYDSYACRKGKGQWAALARAGRFAHGAAFFLKLDIRKYFDSVAHERLLILLDKRFKDERLLAWFSRLIRCYETLPGCGLPIGSLTSQHLANFYLTPLDQFVKEILRRRGYVRYMDDFVIWGACGGELEQIKVAVEEFLAAELRLALKPWPYINRTSQGMDFLGCRVYPGYSTLNRRSRRRFRAKLARYEERFEVGEWDEANLQRHVMALLGFAAQARSWSFRHRVLVDLPGCRAANQCEHTADGRGAGKGQRPIGLEPREPRRQLEQQRPELPVGEPHQEQPGQPEQQPGVSLGPSSDPGQETSRN